MMEPIKPLKPFRPKPIEPSPQLTNVVDQILGRVFNKKIANTELREITGTLSNAFIDYARGEITAAEFDKKVAELRTRFSTLEKNIAETNAAAAGQQ